MNYFYRDTREGRPTLLCVHGFPFDHTMWDALAETLADECRIVAPDLRGMGRTPPANTNIVTMRDLAEDLIGLLDTLGVEKCVFCGLSMGAYVGWEFQENYADRLLGMIICDSNAGCDSPEAAEKRKITAARVETEGPGFLADTMLPNILSPQTVQSRPEIVRKYRRMVEANNARGVAAVARGLGLRRDFRKNVQKISLPALVLTGEADVLSPPVAMRELAESMPNAKFTQIASAGHLAPMENPAETAAAISVFIRQFT